MGNSNLHCCYTKTKCLCFQSHMFENQPTWEMCISVCFCICLKTKAKIKCWYIISGSLPPLVFSPPFRLVLLDFYARPQLTPPPLPAPSPTHTRQLKPQTPSVAPPTPTHTCQLKPQLNILVGIARSRIINYLGLCLLVLPPQQPLLFVTNMPAFWDEGESWVLRVLWVLRALRISNPSRRS